MGTYFNFGTEMDESIQAQFEKLIPLEDKDRHSLPFPML